MSYPSQPWQQTPAEPSGTLYNGLNREGTNNGLNREGTANRLNQEGTADGLDQLGTPNRHDAAQPYHEPQPFFAPPVGQPLSAPLAGQPFSAPPASKPFSAPPVPAGRHAAAEPDDEPYYDFELGQADTQPIVLMPAPASPTALWVTFGVGIAGFVGSFMPWVKINFFGGMSSSGVDGADGWYSVILGAAIAALAIWLVRNPGRHLALSLLALLCTIGLAGLGIYEVAHLSGDIPDGEFAGTVSVGIGLWLIIAAGAAGAVSMVRVLRGRSGAAGQP